MLFDLEDPSVGDNENIEEIVGECEKQGVPKKIEPQKKTKKAEHHRWAGKRERGKHGKFEKEN
jgi:hypothetical protein